MSFYAVDETCTQHGLSPPSSFRKHGEVIHLYPLTPKRHGVYFLQLGIHRFLTYLSFIDGHHIDEYRHPELGPSASVTAKHLGTECQLRLALSQYTMSTLMSIALRSLLTWLA